MVLGSICTIIGMVFACVFPLAKAGDEFGSFDLLTCRQLMIKNKKGQALAYLGNADKFGGDFVLTSDEAVLAFISAHNPLLT